MKRFKEFLGEGKDEDAIAVNGRCAECDEEITSGHVKEGFLILKCSKTHETKVRWNFDV